jgi:hypothetical protein
MTNYTSNKPSGNDFMKDYVDVAQRLIQFRDKYPTGSLQPVNKENPVKIINIGDKTYLEYVAAAYRSPDDTTPGIGVAWELFPGKTPFTRDSEAMVCETSAWGRAIIAALAADTKKGIASKEEVLAAKSRQTTYSEPPTNLSGKITPAQLKQVQIIRKQIPSLDDDNVYRDALEKSYGVRSSTDLTTAQAIDLIKKLNSVVSKDSNDPSN